MEGEAKGEWKPLQLGVSLPVENVQALASSSKHMPGVPPRYIRPDVTAGVLGADNDEEIPIVDLARLLDPASSDDEAKKFQFACEEWGFFQLINHGVPEEVIERMKVDVEEFFGLPLEDKKAYAQVPGDLEGYGQAFVVSEEQQLDWADVYGLTTQPVAMRNMKFWPTQPQTFPDTLDRYSTEMQKATNCLLGYMAKNLGLHAEELIDLFNNGLQFLRINYYPPCPQANEVLGLSPHSDATGLTLLLQVNEVPGLQIKRHGRWFPIKPRPNAFIVNIGDILEMVSNGRYKSIEHRAVINPNEKRISVAAFHDPHSDALVGPLSKLVEGTKYYKTVSLKDYIRLILAAKLDGKNTIDQFKLQI